MDGACAIWILATAGILITRKKVRRLIKLELVAPPARERERMLLESLEARPAEVR